MRSTRKSSPKYKSHYAYMVCTGIMVVSILYPRLQMEDPLTGHGFMPVYNGSAPNYLCIGLKRNSQYKFRVRAQNEEGHSKYSDEVVLCTLPDRPAPPNKPGLKGRVSAYGFKVRWDPPSGMDYVSHQTTLSL